MATSPSNCPACGYRLEAFDAICPRCQGLGLSPSRAQMASPEQIGRLPATPARVEHGRPRWIIAVGAVAATLVLASLLGYRYWISTPQYSLLQAKSAFEAHDLGKFEQYVAIDQCADNFTDDVFAEASAKLQSQSAFAANPFADAGRKMAEGFMGIMKPAISGAIKTKTREFVSTGQIAPPGGGISTGPVDLEKFKSSIENDGLHYDGLGNVAVSDNTATVELRFHNGKKNIDQPLELEMRPLDGHWQIARWKNAVQWMKQSVGTMAP